MIFLVGQLKRIFIEEYSLIMITFVVVVACYGIGLFKIETKESINNNSKKGK